MDHKLLQQAYVKSWDALSIFLRTETRPDHLSSAKRKGWLLRYEKEVTTKLHELLLTVGESLAEAGPFRISRGIVYVNSAFANARIRLPLLGKVPPQVTTSRSVYFKIWSKQVRKGNSRSTMFLEPDRPVHLLTELMWRLQHKDQWGKGFALGLFMSTMDPLFTSLQKYHDNWFFMAAGPKPWPPIDDPSNKTFQDLPGLVGHKTEKHLWDYLSNALNQRRKSVEDQEPEKRCDVPLRRDYSPKEVEGLCQGGLQMLLECWKDAKPAKNIFYVPDVVEMEHLGAIDAEIVFDHKQGDFDPQALSTFLQELQWAVSQYVIRLVVSAERKLATLGDIYRDAYFFSNDATKPLDGGLGVLLNLLANIRGTTKTPAVAVSVLQKIESHFSLAASDRGLYWRGYARQAFEVACCVAQIMEEHLLQSSVRPGLAEQIRSCGPELKQLENQLTDQPFFVQQLFRGLQTEGELFYVPAYREHFIHSFHAFVFGLLLLTIRPKRLIPQDPSYLPISQETLRAWFIVAMWHDIAYSLEKAGGLVETGIRRLIGEVNIKRYSGLLPVQASLGHLLQVEKLIGALFDGSLDWSKVVSIPAPLNARDLILAVALDRTDHGFWSALMLYHAIRCDSAGVKLCKQLTPYNPMEIFGAIVPHHISSWNLDKLVDQFGDYDLASKKYKKWHLDGANSVAIRRDTNKFGYILAIADLLSQAGREAPEFRGVLPSEIGIHLKDIFVCDDRDARGSLEVIFDYERPSNSLKHLLKKHFEQPAAFLNLGTSTTPGTDGLIIRLETRDGKQQEHMFFHI